MSQEKIKFAATNDKCSVNLYLNLSQQIIDCQNQALSNSMFFMWLEIQDENIDKCYFNDIDAFYELDIRALYSYSYAFNDLYNFGYAYTSDTSYFARFG